MQHSFGDAGATVEGQSEVDVSLHLFYEGLDNRSRMRPVWKDEKEYVHSLESWVRTQYTALNLPIFVEQAMTILGLDAVRDTDRRLQSVQCKQP
jgi:hypothetical protein